jgi:hypothetical protein
MSSYGLPPGLPVDGFLNWAVDFLRSKYRERDKRLENIFEHRFNLREPMVPEAFKHLKTDYRHPLVRDVIRRSQAILSAAMPIPRVVPLGISKLDQKNASKREQWLAGAYRKMGRGNNVYSQITDALPADGFAVWKCYLKLQRWGPQRADQETDDLYREKVEKARRAWFPFIWEHVPSHTFYPLAFDGDGLSEVIEITRRSAFECFNMFNVARDSLGNMVEGLGEVNVNPRDLSPADTLECWEYWNRDTYIYAVEGVIVKKEHHDLDRPPYFVANFSASSVHDPQYETEGIADSMLQVQDKLDTFVTVHTNWLILNGFPVGRLRPISEDVVDPYDQDLVVRAKLGETYKAPPGYYFEWVPAPSASNDFHELRTFLSETVDRVSLAPILYGEARDVSGPTSSNLITVAKSVFAPGVMSLALAFDQMAAYMQRTIEQVIEVPVPLWLMQKRTGKWEELGPDDIEGYYEVEHQLNPTIPMERMQKAIHLADAQARGAVSMRHYREEGLGIASPEEMDDEVRVEQYRGAPELRQIVIESTMKKLRARQEARGQGTPPGLPVGPGGPVPQVQGVQQGMAPGMPLNPMAARAGAPAGAPAVPPPNGVAPAPAVPGPGVP